MNKKLILLTTILSIIGMESYASKTNIRRNLSTRNNTRTASSVNLNGTITTINANVEDTTKLTTYDPNTPAPITDQIAKRNCAKMVSNAMDTYCKDNKCTNITQIYANLTYTEIPGQANEIYCANFLESSIKDLLSAHNTKDLSNEKNCNIALATSFAAEDCYLYVMTNQSSQVIINKDELEKRCGINAIKEQYKKITKEEISESDIIHDDLANYFSKVGNIGFSDLLAYPARVMDLKIDFKTSAFPRELVQLVNTIKSQGNVMCGPDRYSQLYDTNMPLEIKQTSWQKARDEKGLFKGTGDWIANQVSAFTGTNTTDEYKEKGMKTWGINYNKCEKQYEETFDAATRSTHTDKFKEEWIKDCKKTLREESSTPTEATTSTSIEGATTPTEATSTTTEETTVTE